MTNRKLEFAERLQLESALARIVDECGSDADWRLIVEARKELGNDVVMAMAKDAADKLRKSRPPGV